MSTITWPANLNFILDRGSFSLDPNDQTAKSDFDDGPPLVRMRFTNPTYLYTGTITVTNSEFMVLNSFYRNELSQGMRWFVIPIWVGNSYLPHKARFKEKYTISDTGWDQYTVGFTLEIRDYFTYGTLALYFMDIYGDLTEEFCDMLDWAINVKYPDILVTRPTTGSPSGLLLAITRA